MKDGTHGFTLVKLLVATLVSAILSLTAGLTVGGASMAHVSRRTMAVHRSRGAAVDLAHERIERLMAIHYRVLAPPKLDYTSYYVSDDGSGGLVVQAADPGETVVIHGLDVPIETRLQYADIDGGEISFDGLMISVSVGYHQKESDRVELEAFYADSGDDE